tara:strand:- start:1196 stop:4021 length:2826 start_codon:yes stop_codon:yes gene_type:complete
MDRLFGFTTPDTWTDGESWDDCNSAQAFNEVFHRIYSSSSEEDPVYRVEPGDNFLVAAAKDQIRDWHPIRDPWYLDIDGRQTAPISIYFGIQKGVSDIDTNLENHAPYISGNENSLFNISADYYHIFGLKMKDSDTAITLSAQVKGIELHNAVLINTPLIKTEGYKMIDWIIRNITFIGVLAKVLDIPLASSNVSLQDIHSTGQGNCGLSVGAGHSDVEVIALTIDNEYHQFDEDKTLYHGVTFDAGSKARARYNTINGFSGNAFIFNCEVDVKGLVSDKCGAGIYFGEYSTGRDCMITFLRQIEGESYAYYFAKGGELNNSGCNLDETGGLGIFAVESGTLTINGGDYQARLPLPAIYAKGACTVVLNNVTINGVLYNETLDFVKGEAWRGQKAEVTLDSLPVFANKTLRTPYMHIPNIADAVSVQGSSTPFSSYIELESGARLLVKKEGAVCYMPLDAWLGIDAPVIDSFRYSTETEIFVHQFTIHPSPEVSALVIDPSEFNNSLTANYAFEENEVYQVSLKISELESGSVTPSIGTASGQYSHSIEGTEVWLIRAPANASQITINTNGFSGNISNVYVRKLLRTETPAVPTLSAETNGNNVTLDFEVLPVARLRDTVVADVIKSGVLDQNSEDGYRSSDNTKHYRFDNVSVSGKRNGITLRGSESLEVNRMVFTGGYPIDGNNAKWQAGIVSEQNSGPFTKIQQICFSDIDLGLPSNYGDYTDNNSDAALHNGKTSGEESFKYSAHHFSNVLKNGSDAVMDAKKHVEINHCELVGACKMLRIHKHASCTVANTQFTHGYGSREVFSADGVSTVLEQWNCYVEDRRCVTVDQLTTDQKGHSDYADKPSIWFKAKSNHVLKTYPTLHPYNRAAMTDMEFQVSNDSGSTWQPLDLPQVGLPGVINILKRTVNFSSGTYQIRCRCLNGALVGAWSNTISITV